MKKLIFSYFLLIVYSRQTMTAALSLTVKLIATTALLAMSVAACLYLWRKRKILLAARPLSTGVLPTVPLLGHGYLILNGFLGMSRILLHSFKEVAASSIRTWAFWLGPYPIFVIHDPADAQIILNSSKALDRGPEVDYARYAFGDGLMTAPGFIWKITRRHTNPLFHPSNLEQLMSELNQFGRELVTSLERHLGCGPVDVDDDIFIIGVKSSANLVFGPDVLPQIKPAYLQRLIHAMANISKLVAVRVFHIWLWPEALFCLVYKKQLKEIDDSWHDFLEKPLECLEEQRKLLLKLEELNDGLPPTIKQGEPTRMTFADTFTTLHKTYPAFNDGYLLNEVKTLMQTGADTTRITTGSCLLALGAHPEIQDKVYAEIVSVLGAEDSDVTVEDVKALPYMEQVLKETLRKFVVVPIVTRKVQEDLKLSHCTVPAGATVCVIFSAVHFDPRFYPEPEKFDPERFSPENVANRPKYTFLAFSAGPRNCIGKTYAMMAMKTLLVHVLRRYRVSTPVDIDHMRYVTGLATTSEDGYIVELHPRH